MDCPGGDEDSLQNVAPSPSKTHHKDNGILLAPSTSGPRTEGGDKAPLINGDETAESKAKEPSLVRKISDLTSDSGRGSVLDNSDLAPNGVEDSLVITTLEAGDSPAKHSIKIVDCTGHLLVPGKDKAPRKDPSPEGPPTPTPQQHMPVVVQSASPEPPPNVADNVPNKSLSSNFTMSSGYRTPSVMSLTPTHSPNQSPAGSPSTTPKTSPTSSRYSKPVPASPIVAGDFARTKHAPKIVYSHSEDKITSDGFHRPIMPNLPYSPYSSPSGSPRLRRQPTKETRSCSITDSDGYTQLNQYQMKEEIGKVSVYIYSHILITFFCCFGPWFNIMPWSP